MFLVFRVFRHARQGFRVFGFWGLRCLGFTVLRLRVFTV